MQKKAGKACCGLRWGIFSVITAIVVVSATADPADARAKRKRSGKSGAVLSYSPPYADIVVDANTGAISKWLYRDPANPMIHMADQAGFQRTGRELALQSPLTEEQVRSLKVGDVVLVSGRAYTGRDAVHAYLMKHDPPVDMNGTVLYHCGPVVVKEGSGWRVTAAGPTTSIREEPYQADVIKRYGVRAIIGKGGMGAKTLAALKEAGAVYLNAIGGAAQFYARTITSVDGVSLTEFGTPEAMWHLTVKDFPAIVTMDAHGNSLHKEIEQESAKELAAIGA